LTDTTAHLQLLVSARDRARKLLDQLLRQQTELSTLPSMIPAETIHEGRIALQGAIDAARAMLENLEVSLQKAHS
jgi:hypothetical protein